MNWTVSELNAQYILYSPNKSYQNIPFLSRIYISQNVRYRSYWYNCMKIYVHTTNVSYISYPDIVICYESKHISYD